MKDKKQTYNIKDFIGVFDNFIDDQICDQLIEGFYNEERFKKTYNRIDIEGVSSDQKKDLSCTVQGSNLENSFKHVPILFKTAMENVVHLYRKETNIEVYTAKELHWAPFKVQKTKPSEGYHQWHVERGYNMEAISRVLVFTVYLNDIEEGGETEFLYQHQRVAPKKGTVCVFPAHFPYVHRGNPPLKGTKYIATGWFLSNFF